MRREVLSSDDLAYYCAEIALAIRWAADLAGLRDAEWNAIFYDNGMALLQAVSRGAPAP